MHYCIKLFSVGFMFFTLQSTAQKSIQTDQPDQTECPYIAPGGYVQLVTGTSIEQLTKENKLYSHPSLLIKYGILKEF
jgi:hypothetical protein